jgi:DNA polymerase/3'-5' exonuclease PolX
MELRSIQRIADDIFHQLQPHCEEGFIHIAGSIRRKKPDCGDIEIVCLPKSHQISEELFESKKGFVRDQEFINTVRKWMISSGDFYGRYMKIMYQYGDEFDIVQLDLFMPRKEDYYRHLVIRTGSADYSARVVAAGWVKLGWQGTEDGLRRKTECTFTYLNKEKTKKKWFCFVKNPILPPAWQSEEEFFEWLQVPYIEPEKRI